MSLLNVHDFRKGNRDIFLDTEFLQQPGERTQLISVAMVEGEGDEFRHIYLVNGDFDLEAAEQHQFVSENVLPYLGDPAEWLNESAIRTLLRAWVGGPRFPVGGVMPRFWGWFSGLDYAVLQDLYGGIDGWPPEWPMSIYDLSQFHEALAPQVKMLRTYPVSISGIPDDEYVPHNALFDAVQLQARFKHFCSQLESAGPPSETGVQ